MPTDKTGEDEREKQIALLLAAYEKRLRTE